MNDERGAGLVHHASVPLHNVPAGTDATGNSCVGNSAAEDCVSLRVLAWDLFSYPLPGGELDMGALSFGTALAPRLW